VQVTGEVGERPEVGIPAGPPPCDLVSRDLAEGDGEVAAAGGTVQVHYYGMAWSTQVMFDTSWDRGDPFSFTIGAGNVIAGWDQGVPGMKVGGRRVLVIPSDLGYGEQGSGAIQGGETLVFVVDLISVSKPPSCRERDVALSERRGAITVRVAGRMNAKPRVTVPEGDPPCELQVLDVREGSGRRIDGETEIEAHYVGISWSTRKQFDASWDRGESIQFVVGAGAVIKGWDEGLAGMRVGGRRLLVIPPELGYGASGAGADIAPFETLVFVVDLLKAEPAGDGS